MRNKTLDEKKGVGMRNKTLDEKKGGWDVE